MFLGSLKGLIFISKRFLGFFSFGLPLSARGLLSKWLVAVLTCLFCLLLNLSQLSVPWRLLHLQQRQTELFNLALPFLEAESLCPDCISSYSIFLLQFSHLPFASLYSTFLSRSPSVLFPELKGSCLIIGLPKVYLGILKLELVPFVNS